MHSLIKVVCDNKGFFVGINNGRPIEKDQFLQLKRQLILANGDSFEDVLSGELIPVTTQVGYWASTTQEIFVPLCYYYGNGTSATQDLLNTLY